MELDRPWGSDEPFTRIVAIGAAGSEIDQALADLVEASSSPA